MSVNAFYQEIFAEFVVGARESEAQCWWYSIKPLRIDTKNSFLALPQRNHMADVFLGNSLAAPLPIKDLTP
jgi:hypothetical protein